VKARLKDHMLLELPRYVARNSRLLFNLPALLRRPISIEEARQILRRRLERRADDFLELFRSAVIGNPASPYNALLRHAGCELGDVERTRSVPNGTNR
jgi:hypothetical protein